MSWFGKHEHEEDKSKVVDNEKLLLRKEELDIGKDKVRTGEVTIGKNIVEEQKMVNVPVTHEEVVIERRAIDNEPSDSPITAEGSIHIPVSEERVKVDKHTVLTGEVSAYKKEVVENKKVDETLKREEAHIDTEGDAHIINNEDNPRFH